MLLLKKVCYIFFILTFLSCKQTSQKEAHLSFYYWKSKIHLGQTELKCLNDNHCQRLYIRCFDVVAAGEKIRPAAIIDSLPVTTLQIVPVVYIENNVFKQLDKSKADTLFKNVLRLLNEIGLANHQTFTELQVDCDWTDKTRNLYFYFLEKFKQTKWSLTATIRLHQVKYFSETGIPPVKKGVLMYYNFGKIAGDSLNSIYQKSIGEKYIAYLKNYPLHLNVALPVFSWGIQSRNGRVVELLNKLNEQNFLNDPDFTQLSSIIFKAKNTCFKNGYYFEAGDDVKIESVSADQLKEIALDLKNNLKQVPEEIIFYDLDSVNLKRYDEKIFEQIRNSFN